MSVSIPESHVYHEHLESLQHLCNHEQVELDWLVIAHSDPVMVRRLSEVVRGKSAAMLQIPLSGRDGGRGELAEAVEWSIGVAGIKHLLLAGHSQCGPSTDSARWLGETAHIPNRSNSLHSSYNRLLAGVQRVQDGIQQSQDHFAAQVTQLCERKTIRDSLAKGQVQLHTLFYIAQSGVFQVFDFAAQTYRPLVA